MSWNGGNLTLANHTGGSAFTWAKWLWDKTNENLAGTGQQIASQHLIIKLYSWAGTSNYSYSSFLQAPEIELYGDGRYREFTVMHEFGHFVMSYLRNFTPSPGPGGPHGSDFNNNHPDLTLTEGFADGYSFIMDEITRAALDQESGRGWIGEYHDRVLLADNSYTNLTHPFVAEKILGAAMLDSWDGPANYAACGNTQPAESYNDIGNDNFEMPLGEILRAIYSPSYPSDFTTYFENLQRNLAGDCVNRTRLRDLWLYNFTNVEPSVDPTGTGAPFKILNTDLISEVRSITTPRFSDALGSSTGSVSWNYVVDVRDFDSPNDSYHLTKYNEAYRDYGSVLYRDVNATGATLSDDILLTNGAEFYIHGSPAQPVWLNRGLPQTVVSRTIINSHFLANTCGHPTIRVGAGSKLELGSVSPYRTTEFTVETGSLIDINGGTLVINSGSTLRLRAGATLIVAGITNVLGVGNIIVEPGARLEIRPGAQLVLRDNDSKLTLQGGFAIKAGATFQPTGNGYVSFELPAGSGNANIEIGDRNSKFILRGPDPSHRIAKVAAGTHLQPTYWGDFTFTIENGSVELGRDAWISCAAAVVSLQNATFQWRRQAVAPRLRPEGVYVHGCGRETIRDCRFVGGEHGLVANLNSCNGTPGVYENLAFENCRYGLKTIGKGATLINCTFSGNLTPTHYMTGWKMEGAEFAENKVVGCTFSGCERAIDFVGGASVNLRLEGPQIHHNRFGVSFYSFGQLQPKCGAVYSNTDCGLLVKGGTLNLSGDVNGNESNFSLLRNGGRGVSSNIYLDRANSILLDNGHNDIISPMTSKAGIKGSIFRKVPLPAGSIGGYIQQVANGNRWNVNNQPPSPTYTPGDVAVVILGTNGSSKLRLTDAAPAGYTLCNVNPCIVPMPVGSASLPCWLHDRVASCPTCPVISTSFAAPDSLHHLVEQAIASQLLYDPIRGNDGLAMTHLAELQLSPLVGDSEGEQLILDEAYSAMQTLYAGASDALRAEWNQNALLQAVIDEQIATSAPDTALTNPEFHLRMDQALMAYAAGDLTAARADLALANPLNTPLTQDTYDYWECFLATTQQFRDSTLTEMEYLQQLETCHQPFTASRGQVRQTPDEYIAEQLAQQAARQVARRAKAVAQARVQLAPNPATGAVTVTLAEMPIGSVNFALRDLTGQTVRRWQRTATAGAPTAWTLDVTGVVSGVYLLEVGTSARTETRRLVIGAGGTDNRP
ncbi:MAG: T9SS type A sorting domain-containing protein [Hymenobacteraceae bacterium]|nr:T9SS type A sorting domain-containing protein [Hymenobacteraceae bacterium]